MEEPVPADEDSQQQSEVGAEGSLNPDSKTALSSPETDNDGFDADMFASMMKQELIAYSVSWDPLMKVLQALGAFMAKQQRTQQGNDAAMKKMEDQVAALRGDLARAEDEKKEAAAAMEAMQNQVGEMQNQLEEIQGLAPIEDQEEQQGQQGATDDQDKSSVEGPGGEKDGSGGVSPTVKSPRSPRASSIGRQPFVTAKELDEAKRNCKRK